MNPWQMLQQIQHELQQATWPGGSQDAVFGTRGTFVTSGTPSREQIQVASYPWVAVGLSSASPDADEPDLLMQSFRVFVAALSMGDRDGDQAIVGGPIADIGKSANRGSEELTQIVRTAIGKLTGIDGSHIIFQTAGSGAVFDFGPAQHIAVSELQFSAWCTSELYYAPPQKLAYNEGDTEFSWEGSQCSSRFDFKQFRLVEKVGSAPTDPSDGTVVATTTNESATYSAVSTRYYGVFADYNPRDTTGSVIDSSDSIVGSYLVAP